MAFELITFDLPHTVLIDVQGEQRAELSYLIASGMLEAYSSAVTGVDTKTGVIVGFAGVVPYWKGRAYGWAVYNQSMPRAAMCWIYHATRDYLDRIQEDPDYRRVETNVRADWRNGERWARLLGFANEGRHVAFGPDGSDYCTWARIR